MLVKENVKPVQGVNVPITPENEFNVNRTRTAGPKIGPEVNLSREDAATLKNKMTGSDPKFNAVNPNYTSQLDPQFDRADHLTEKVDSSFNTLEPEYKGTGQDSRFNTSDPNYKGQDPRLMGKEQDARFMGKERAISLGSEVNLSREDAASLKNKRNADPKFNMADPTYMNNLADPMFKPESDIRFNNANPNYRKDYRVNSPTDPKFNQATGGITTQKGSVTLGPDETIQKMKEDHIAKLTEQQSDRKEHLARVKADPTYESKLKADPSYKLAYNERQDSKFHTSGPKRGPSDPNYKNIGPGTIYKGDGSDSRFNTSDPNYQRNTSDPRFGTSDPQFNNVNDPNYMHREPNSGLSPEDTASLETSRKLNPEEIIEPDHIKLGRGPKNG